MKNIWTLHRDAKAGEVLSICYHRVVVKSVVEQKEHYAKCEVEVLGPIRGAAGRGPAPDFKPFPIPPLMMRGELYDTDGVFVEQ
jgi:hypothetical protein